ncbi:uncharacterized protein EAF02_005986 [Botrytis sinoallii]|uniref:uncharacterized protein n=1 Tax=Botrytis sinoallii TaxID=1463999 RepID=UPI0019017B9C|nr:uncharacterized protein EAF02_005986 [Botrytis sinoallii]KAF7882623.1 hypothetical protein EAF02_005986 [Botrytis sinoallii]
MVATARTALLSSLVSIVAAQSVNLFIPEYGQEDVVAQIVGENAEATTYLIACAPAVYTTVACVYRNGPGRDEGPPNCDGPASYNVVDLNRCFLTAGATVVEGPSTVVFIKPGDDSQTWNCAADGTVSAVCTHNYRTNIYTDTMTGTDYTFIPVPLTTGLVANGVVPTSIIRPAQASTTSILYSTSSSPSSLPSSSTSIHTISSLPTITPIATIRTSITTRTTSSIEQQSNSSSARSSSFGAGSVSSISGNNTATSTTVPAATGVSNTTSPTPIVSQISNGAPAFGWWKMGSAVVAVLAGIAML